MYFRSHRAVRALLFKRMIHLVYAVIRKMFAEQEAVCSQPISLGKRSSIELARSIRLDTLFRYIAKSLPNRSSDNEGVYMPSRQFR